MNLLLHLTSGKSDHMTVIYSVNSQYNYEKGHKLAIPKRVKGENERNMFVSVCRKLTRPSIKNGHMLSSI
jgi:hypothetical protein